MRFQESRLHGHHTVIGCVALIKTVVGKPFPILEDIFGNLLFDAAFNRAFDEFLVVFLQLVGLFSWK
jgi:hypothetical protein